MAIKLLPLLKEKIIVEPPPPDRVGITSQIASPEFESVFTSLKNIYPSKFVDDTPETKIRVVREVYQSALDKPEEFHQDLMTIGRTPDTVNILKSFGANDEQVNQILPPIKLNEKEAKVLYDQKMRQIFEAYKDIADYRVKGWVERRAQNPERVNAWKAEEKQAWDEYQSNLPGYRESLMGRAFLPSIEGYIPGEMPTATWLTKVKELSDTPGELIPFAGSSMEMGYIIDLLKTANDLKDGREVNKEALLALKQYVDRSQRDTTWGYKVVDVVANLIPWGLEFLITGGIYTAGEKAGVEASTEALKWVTTKTGLKVLENALVRYGVKVAGVIAGGTLRAIPIGLAKIPVATLEKQLQHTLTGDEESVWLSLVKSAGENWVETVSESTGGLFEPLTAPIKGQLVKMGIFRAFLKANPTKAVNDIRKIVEKIGYNGIIGEMLEERVADVWHGILYELGLGDQKFSIPSLEQLGVELVSFSIPGVAFKTAEEISKRFPEMAAEARAEPERGAIIPGAEPREVTPVTPEVTIPKEYQVYQGVGKGRESLWFTTDPNRAIKYAQKQTEGRRPAEPVIRIWDRRDIEKRIAPQGRLSDLQEGDHYSYTELNKIPYKEVPLAEFQVAIPKAEVGMPVTPEVTEPKVEIIQRQGAEQRPFSGKITIGDRVFTFQREPRTVGMRTGYGAFALFEQLPKESIFIGRAKTQTELVNLAQSRVVEPAIPKAEIGMPEVTEAQLPEGVRGIAPEEVASTRAEMGTLANYTDDISFRSFLGKDTKYWNQETYNKAKAGQPFKIYRAVPTTITEIHSGAWVTQSREYAQMHLESILRGEGHIIEGTTKASDLIAMAENEFFYAPEAVTPTAPMVETTAIAPEVPTAPPISEVPPIPPEPPKTVSPDNPIVPPPQIPKEIDRIIEYSQKAYEVNGPRALTKLMYKVPGLHQVLKLWRPNLQVIGNKEAEKLYVAMIAEGEARFNVATWALSSRLEVFKQIKSVFGKEVLHGGKVDVEFKGTPAQVKNPITGTLKDIADNPDLYKLNQKQKDFLTFLNDRNDKLLDWVNEGYDAEIGKFIPKEGGAYLPNVDKPEDIGGAIVSEMRAVVSGRGKTRIWQTARERMAGKTPFNPELDVVKLINGLDSFKSSVAGAQSYKKILGGLTRLEAMEKTHPELYQKMMGLRKELQSLQGSAGTIESNIHKAIFDFLNSPVEDTDLATLRDNLDVKLKSGPRVLFNVKDVQDEIARVREQIKVIRPAWEVANLKPYVFVQEGIYRYFNGDVANMIKEARMTTKNPVLRFMDNWRAGAFSGDLSPFGQQGVIGVLADPIGSLKAGIGAVQSATQRNDFLYAVKIEALAEDIAKEPELWARYASLIGRQLMGTPREYAAGFLSKIPGFDKFTEATYITVTRQSFDLWKRTFRDNIKRGMDEVTAQVIAAKDTTEVYPLYNPTLLGQSEKMASYFRAMPTSISFIIKPATLIEDGMIGMAKATTFGKVPLSPKESLALKRLITIAASVLITSAVSAYLSSKARDESDEEALQAMLNAVNPDPNNGKFASIIIGNIRIPLGGPYRAIFRAIYPREVAGIPFPVPFVGLWDYGWNRVNPSIKTQIDLIANKDYFGKAILSGDLPEMVLRGLEYEVENVLPLTAGSVMEDIRTGKTPQIRQDVISQFMGVNAVNMDDTYFKKLIRQLGLPDPDFVPIPNSINVVPDYTTKDLWGDVTKYVRKIDPDALKWYPDLIQEIARAIPIYDEMKLIPNTKLININADPDKGDTYEQYYQQWLDRQKDPEAYDKKYPDNKAYLGNMTQAQYALLRQYHDLEREGDKVRFLRTHPEVNINPRKEWLKTHPKENATLAIWGQTDAETLDSYNKAKSDIDNLGIPDNAIGEELPPDSIAEEYYAYITKLAEGRVNEAKALLYQNPELYKYVKGEPLPTRPTGGGEGGPSTEFFK